MGIEIIKNQPVQSRFSYKYDLAAEYERMQLVQQDDVQRVQFRCTPAVAPVPYVSGWSFSGGFSQSVADLNCHGTGSALRTIPLLLGKRYQIDFDVEIASLGDNAGYRLNYGGQWIKLADTSGSSLSVLSGHISVQHTVVSTAFFSFSIGVMGSANITFRNIVIRQLSEPVVAILDEGKNRLFDLASIDITDEADSDISTCRIDWKEFGLPDGIYYIRIGDKLNLNAELLTNGNFATNLNGWSNLVGFPLEWVWNNYFSWHVAYYNGTGDINNRLFQQLMLPGGNKYTLSFRPFTLGSGLKLFFEINGLVTEPRYYRNIFGDVQTVVLDLSAYDDFVSVYVDFQPEHITDVVRLAEVSLKRTEDVSNISNPFKLQASHSGTMKISGICNNSAFGFNFANYFASLRVRGTILYKQYPDFGGVDIYQFSNNRSDIISSKAAKTYEVTIAGTAEYLHDALSLIRLMDYMAIDGKQYILQGDYELIQTEGLLNCSARFIVKEKEGIPDNLFEGGYAEPGYFEEVYARDGRGGAVLSNEEILVVIR